jgi:y4mF family transcriptional regulator
MVSTSTNADFDSKSGYAYKAAVAMRVTTPEDLGNIVREKREARGLTQRQLADHAGVSRLWLLQIEAGHAGAEFGRVLRLIASLDLALDLVERRGAAIWQDVANSSDDET